MKDFPAFLSAVEAVIGRPGTPAAGSSRIAFELDTPHGPLVVSVYSDDDVPSVHIRFTGDRKQWQPLIPNGVSPKSGRWSIAGGVVCDSFSEAAEHCLRELPRRLAAAGFDPGAAVEKPAEGSPGLVDDEEGPAWHCLSCVTAGEKVIEVTAASVIDGEPLLIVRWTHDSRGWQSRRMHSDVERWEKEDHGNPPAELLVHPAESWNDPLNCLLGELQTWTEVRNPEHGLSALKNFAGRAHELLVSRALAKHPGGTVGMPVPYPPLPPGYRIAGQLKDHDGITAGITWRSGSKDWATELLPLEGMKQHPGDVSADWWVAVKADTAPPIPGPLAAEVRGRWFPTLAGEVIEGHDTREEAQMIAETTPWTEFGDDRTPGAVYLEENPGNPCKCIDCGGTEAFHSPDCTWMQELHGEPMPVVAPEPAAGLSDTPRTDAIFKQNDGELASEHHMRQRREIEAMERELSALKSGSPAAAGEADGKPGLAEELTVTKLTDKVLEALTAAGGRFPAAAREQVSRVLEKAMRGACEKAGLLVAEERKKTESAWTNRNHFCREINIIGHEILGFTGDCCAPDAVTREIRKLVEGLKVKVDAARLIFLDLAGPLGERNFRDILEHRIKPWLAGEKVEAAAGLVLSQDDKDLLQMICDKWLDYLQASIGNTAVMLYAEDADRPKLVAGMEKTRAEVVRFKELWKRISGLPVQPAAGLTDAQRLDHLERAIRQCPHAVLTFIDDPDQEDGDAAKPFIFEVSGCDTFRVRGASLREVLDADITTPDDNKLQH